MFRARVLLVLSAMSSLSLTAHLLPAAYALDASPARLVADYAFDDGTARDASGNGNDGWLPASGVTPTNGCMLFDGKRGSAITVPHTPTLSITQRVTIAAWVYENERRNAYLVSKNPSANSTGNYGFVIKSTADGGFFDGTQRFAVFNGASATFVDGGSALPTKQWSHVAITVDTVSRTASFYVNGRLASTAPWTAGLPANAADLTIGFGEGDSSPSQPFSGYMDDVRLYDGTLTSSEIAVLAASRPTCLQPVSPTLAAQYTFDDGTARDVSGNGNHGRLPAAGVTPVNGCMLFAGNRGNFMAVPNSQSLSITGRLTIAAWVYENERRNAYIVSKNPSANATGNYGFIIKSTADGGAFDGTQRFAVFHDKSLSSVDGGKTLSTRTWSHVAVTVDTIERQAKFYIDGRLESTAPWTAGLPANAADLTIGFGEGDSSPSQPFSGYMDDVRVYDGTLSDSQIADIARVIPTCFSMALCQDGIDNDADGRVDMQDPGCASPQDNDEGDDPACADRRDNDGDGLVDFPADPGCASLADPDESNPSACQDGIDNDSDGAVDFPNDFSCSSPTDTDEMNPKAACQDGSDNDGDGKTDFPLDPGCTSKQDNDEFNQLPQCSDSIDNDGDGRVDYPLDPGCDSATDTTEGNDPACGDGIDNDGDGATDFPADFSCTSPTDNDETNTKAACQDGLDNDGDGLRDFPQDPGCVSKQDNDETNAIVPQCRDGIDNDNDGRVDFPADPGCSNQDDTTEGGDPACADRVDNDNDGLVDFPQDPGCASLVDNDETNVIVPQCRDGIDNDNDGRVDSLDPGCSNPDDTNEGDDPACSDRIDNDNDGLADFPFDPGCASPTDTDEFNQVQTVDLTIQKTGPATVVRGQPLFYQILVGNSGTTQATNVVVSDTVPTGLVYNDALSYGPCVLSGNVVSCPLNSLAANQFGSFYIAFDTPAVQSCSAVTVTNVATISGAQTDSNPANNTSSTQGSPTRIDCPVQLAQCQDFNDNDFDGRIDFPADPGCSSPTDNNENDEAACQDGRDNDNDGRVDFPQDPGCSSPTDTDETDPVTTPQCRDGIDNDGDGRVDTNDAGCSNGDDNNEGDGAADLGIALTGPATVQGGSTAAYVATVANNGPDAATSPFSIRISIPTGVTFNAAQSSQGCTRQGTTVVCSNITLGLFQQTTRSIVFNIPGNGQQASAFNLLNFALGVETAHAQVGGVCNTTFQVVGTIQGVQPDQNQANNQSQVTTSVTCQALAQCQDGIDNDADGKVDFPADPGCSSQTDTDETDVPQFGCVEIKKETFDPHGNPLPIAAQFTFILDATRVAYNDASGRARFDNLTAGTHSVAEIIPSGWTQLSVSPQNGVVTVTPGTACAQVTFRNRQVFVANSQCADGYDNDGDGLTDYPQDQGCSSATDNDEYNSTFVPQCRDGRDNDNDGRIDFPQDQGCVNADDNNEADQNAANPPPSPAAQCNDGLDNDNDGKVDYPADPGCSSATDTDEFNFRAPRCSDGLDNDGDGLKDYPQDTGCTTPYDDNEYNDRLRLDRWREFWNWSW